MRPANDLHQPGVDGRTEAQAKAAQFDEPLVVGQCPRGLRLNSVRPARELGARIDDAGDRDRHDVTLHRSAQPVRHVPDKAGSRQ